MSIANYVEAPAILPQNIPGPSIFLAGGISNCPDWHTEVRQGLLSTCPTLTVVNPKVQNFNTADPTATVRQIEWEFDHLNRCTVILFWFPAETLCPIALYELGRWNASDKKLFVGCHEGYQRAVDVIIQTRLAKGDEVVVVRKLGDLVDQVKAWYSSLASNGVDR